MLQKKRGGGVSSVVYESVEKKKRECVEEGLENVTVLFFLFHNPQGTTTIKPKQSEATCCQSSLELSVTGQTPRL